MKVRYDRKADGSSTLTVSTTLGFGGSKWFAVQTFPTEVSDFGEHGNFVAAVKDGRLNLEAQVYGAYTQDQGVSNE